MDFGVRRSKGNPGFPLTAVGTGPWRACWTPERNAGDPRMHKVSCSGCSPQTLLIVASSTSGILSLRARVLTTLTASC